MYNNIYTLYCVYLFFLRCIQCIQQDVTLDVASFSPMFQTKVFPKSSRHQFCAPRFRGDVIYGALICW